MIDIKKLRFIFVLLCAHPLLKESQLSASENPQDTITQAASPNTAALNAENSTSLQELGYADFINQNQFCNRVIGLGHRCSTKLQINQYFNPDHPATKTKPGHADLFDWLFIHNYNKLAEALTHNLEDFFEISDMELRPHKNPDGYLNRKYSMYWNHLLVNFSKETYNDGVTLSDEAVFYQTIKKKMNYLRNKFIEAKDYSTLYIISEVGLTLESLINVRNALTHIRQGNKDFMLLYIASHQTFEGVENIIVRESPQGVTVEQADSARWQAILGEFKFTDDIWA